jgi:hypothetical protein
MRRSVLGHYQEVGRVGPPRRDLFRAGGETLESVLAIVSPV